MSDYIFLDPDGTAGFGLLLLVLHPTGVRYGSQVAGLATELRSAEGFLIPLGQNEVEAQLISFFRAEFAGHSYRSTAEWTPARLDRLGQILSAVRVWRTYPDPGQGETPRDDEVGGLTLDLDRLEDLTEAWVPVQSMHGPAVLLFENCD